MTLLPTCWWENWHEMQNLSGVLFENERRNLFIILRLLRCGACCTTHLLTHLHERLLLHPASAVGLCVIYKLGELTGQRFQAMLSPSSHWKFTEFRAETVQAFGIPNYVTPPPPSFGIPVKKSPSPSEFQDVARGMVWIFSGNHPMANNQCTCQADS